jgi:hypothetical protein
MKHRMTAWTACAAIATAGCAGQQAESSRADAAHVASTVADPRSANPTAARAEPGLSTAALDPNARPATTSMATTSSAPVSRTAPKTISARHVLVQWMGSERAGSSVLRSREQALTLVNEVLKRAKAGEDLGRLAVDYSDEPNAGARGGSLGRFTRGQMVPAFDHVAFSLDVGQISEVVETPFGFHVIQRTE